MSQEPRSIRDIDDEIDAAMNSTMSKTVDDKKELPLKRQWDAELDAELEAAMAEFDFDKFDGNLPRRDKAFDRAQSPKGGRGQEDRKGPQKAKVVAVRKDTVFVDLGGKSEGAIPIAQFSESLPNVGDVVEVRVDRFNKEEGLFEVSLKGATVDATWENLEKGLIVEALVTKTIKGGLEVTVNGLRAFLPIGQIDVNRVEDASIYVNQRLRVVVTELNVRERNLVVSSRELLEQERAEKREATWKELEEGQIRDGVVRSVKDFGAFVDIGGVDGLIHVSDLSWARVKDVSSIIKVGQNVRVKVLKIDRETKKVGLGFKQLSASPWDTIEDRLERGQTVEGKVTRLMDFGAFVELEPGVEGLVHISELSPNRVRRVADIVKPDQAVEARILQIDPVAKKISLTLKPLPQKSAEPEPEPEAEEANETPAPPKPERKIPLKGGLGDADPRFRMP